MVKPVLIVIESRNDTQSGLDKPKSLGLNFSSHQPNIRVQESNVATMTRFIATEYLCHKQTWICSVCSYHNLVLQSFIHDRAFMVVTQRVSLVELDDITLRAPQFLVELEHLTLRAPQFLVELDHLTLRAPQFHHRF